MLSTRYFKKMFIHTGIYLMITFFLNLTLKPRGLLRISSNKDNRPIYLGLHVKFPIRDFWGINIWQLFLCVCVTLFLYFWGIQIYLKIMRVVLHKKRRNACL